MILALLACPRHAKPDPACAAAYEDGCEHADYMGDICTEPSEVDTGDSAYAACFADGVNDCWPVYSDWYGCG